VLDAVHSAESIKYMVRMLTDQDPRNRTTARLMLHHASRDSLLSPTVHVELMNLLDGKNLFGKEQSAVLLGRLQYQLATERLVAMLRSPDLSDRLAAIVGLRWMGDRRTLPIVFDRARELISQWPRDIRRTRTVGMSMELSQMLQMFGALQYRDEEVDRFMKRFIPQRASLYSSRARAAAIWSLGRIYEGERDEELAMLLLARLLDVRIGFSEHDSIRQHAVMALGRMEVGDIPVPALQSTIEEIIYNIVIQRNTLGKVQLACRWAVRRMTNRPIPPLPPEFEISSSWFLSPVGRPR